MVFYPPIIIMVSVIRKRVFWSIDRHLPHYSIKHIFSSRTWTLEQNITSEILRRIMDCYELNCVAAPSNPYVKILTPSTSGCDLVWNYGYCKGYLDEVIRVDPNLIWLVSLQKGKFSLSPHLSPYHFPSSPPFPCPHSFFPSFIFCWTSWKRETGRQKQDFSF